jgi:hypothetical protein
VFCRVSPLTRHGARMPAPTFHLPSKTPVSKTWGTSAKSEVFVPYFPLKVEEGEDEEGTSSDMNISEHGVTSGELISSVVSEAGSDVLSSSAFSERTGSDDLRLDTTDAHATSTVDSDATPKATPIVPVRGANAASRRPLFPPGLPAASISNRPRIDMSDLAAFPSLVSAATIQPYPKRSGFGDISPARPCFAPRDSRAETVSSSLSVAVPTWSSWKDNNNDEPKPAQVDLIKLVMQRTDYAWGSPSAERRCKQDMREALQEHGPSELVHAVIATAPGEDTALRFLNAVVVHLRTTNARGAFVELRAALGKNETRLLCE